MINVSNQESETTSVRKLIATYIQIDEQKNIYAYIEEEIKHSN